MKTKVLNWARSTPLDPTVRWLAIAAWLQDVLSCLYLVKWWEHKQLGSSLMLMAFKVNKIDIENVPYDFQTDFLSFTAILFAGFLLALVITNTVFYVAYAKKKRWAIPYVTGYVVTAGILGLSFWFEGFPVGGAWELINIVGAPVYLVMGLVAWARKPELVSSGVDAVLVTHSPQHNSPRQG